MRWLLTLALLLPGAALAQTEVTPVPNIFIDMQEIYIESMTTKPKLMHMNARQRAKHGKLLELKKDFLPRISATARDRALR